MDVLDISLIKLNIPIKNKEEVFKSIAQLSANSGRLIDTDKYLMDMKKREAHCSTAFGNLIAIPHAKSDAVKSAFLGFIRTEKAIDWEEEKAQLIFFIGVAEGANHLHLEMLAAISRQLIEDDFRKKLLTAQSEIDVLNILKNTLKESKR